MAKSGAVSMTEGPLIGILLRVAWPITLTNLFQSFYDIINSFWVGRLGENAIAAVAASGPLFFVLIALGSGLTTAGAVLIAQYAGAKRHDMLDHVAAQTLLMVALIALAFPSSACSPPRQCSGSSVSALQFMTSPMIISISATSA